MQTPRGFLVGAGVIAAVATIATIGSPRPQTSVEMASPRPEVEGTWVTPPTLPIPEMPVRPERVETGAGAGPTTSVDIGGPATSSLAPSSTESTVTSVDSAPATTLPVDVSADRPSVPREEEVSPTATTVAAAVTTAAPVAAPPASPSTTLPPASTTVTTPPVTAAPTPSIPASVSVPPVTIPPPVTLPPVTIPQAPTIPAISIPVINPAVRAAEIDAGERPVGD